MNLGLQLPDGGFKIVEALERMAATEIEKVEFFSDRINRIDRIKIGEIEEPLDVGDFNRRAAATKIGANPVGLGFAGGDKHLSAAEAKALDGADKSLLPTMIGPPDWIITCLWHPTDVPAPQRRPPEAGQPSTMNPYLVSGSKLANRCPRAE